MALPIEKNIILYRGDTYSTVVRLRGSTSSGGPSGYLDLTGCTAEAQIRATTSSATVIADFTCVIPDQTVTDNLGKIFISLTPLQATSVTSGVWDLQVTFDDGSVVTFLRGSVTAEEDVTRD